MQKNRRVSNIELLRILSIFLITMHHLVVHGSNACGYLTNYSFEQGTLGIILNSFCIIGVNVFILISGWFGIKNPIKATIHLIVDFVILSTLMNIGLYLHQGNLGELNIIETYKFKYLWFLYDYIILALLSPLLERLIKSMSLKTYTIFMLIITFINVVICYGLELVNSNGYGLLNFLYLYFVARYLRRSFEIGALRRYSSSFFAILYIGLSLLAAGCYFLLAYMGFGESLGGVRFFSYNNPIFLLSSICLLLSFSIVKPFYSNMVNVMATGVFSVYILQSSMQLCSYRVLLSKLIYGNYSYFGLFVFGISILMFFSIIGVLVEKNWSFIESKSKKILNIWNEMN